MDLDMKKVHTGIQTGIQTDEALSIGFSFTPSTPFRLFEPTDAVNNKRISHHTR